MLATDRAVIEPKSSVFHIWASTGEGSDAPGGVIVLWELL
jgi:hypothetical protein